MSVTFTFPVYFQEYLQNNLYRVPPTYSPISSQMMHHPQSALWGYNIMGQPQQPGFFVQNQPLPPGTCGLAFTDAGLYYLMQDKT